MNKSDIKDELSDILSSYNPTFTKGFTERVMKSVDIENIEEEETELEFYNIFRWVAFSGVAAIIMLLFTVYLTEGTFSEDAFYGLMYYTPDEPVITSLNF